MASFFFRGHEGDDVVDRGLVRAALSEVIVRPHFLEKQEAPRGGRFEREEAGVDLASGEGRPSRHGPPFGRATLGRISVTKVVGHV